MQAPKQARLEWTALLRRQATYSGAGPPEDDYSAFEVICRMCGDDPSLDYREVSPMLQRLRGPYWLAPGVDAYENHLEWHQKLLRDATGTLPRSRGDRGNDHSGTTGPAMGNT